jgi:hypothetical protein
VELGQPVGMRSEEFTNGTRFQGIIDERARTMGVDVTDLLGSKPSIK